MKQENIYIYQWLYRLRYVPIMTDLHVASGDSKPDAHNEEPFG